MGAHSAAATKLLGLISFFYLKVVSMLKIADLLGHIVFKAISEPEYVQKDTKRVSQKENHKYSLK